VDVRNKLYFLLLPYIVQFTLVLDSRYIDTILKAVDLAKKEGYKIDGISAYITTFEASGTVNTLVAMSRG
jgi:hypothetical protein